MHSKMQKEILQNYSAKISSLRNFSPKVCTIKKNTEGAIKRRKYVQ